MWTDERVELLKKLWADGLSASRIAAELGGITRNAVIGKVHRLGLSGRAKTPSSSVSRPRKPRSSSHLFRSMRPAVRGNTALAARFAYEYDPVAQTHIARIADSFGYVSTATYNLKYGELATAVERNTTATSRVCTR